MRPRLLIVDQQPALRVRLVAALSADFELVVPAPGDDPLRLARSSRPDIVLLASGGGARGAALRLARVLKTDVRAVPRLGLYAVAGHDGPSEAAFTASLADGFCATADDPASVLRFAAALARGESPRPQPWPAPSGGPWRRLLERWIGARGRGRG